MDNLKEYIDKNREAFDVMDIPEGSEDRFVALAERRGRVRIGFMTVALTGIAAALAGVIFIMHPARETKDWFAGVGDDQFEICNAYYEKLASYYEGILGRDPEMENTLSAIADEAIPLADQLPDELAPEVRAGILKEYYSDLLDGLDRLDGVAGRYRKY